MKVMLVNGSPPEQVREDREELRNLRMLAKNMAWFLQCKEAGNKMGVPPGCSWDDCGKRAGDCIASLYVRNHTMRMRFTDCSPHGIQGWLLSE